MGNKQIGSQAKQHKQLLRGKKGLSQKDLLNSFTSLTDSDVLFCFLLRQGTLPSCPDRDSTCTIYFAVCFLCV